MAKTRSDKSKWPSRYSPGGWVTANQYIVELLCEKKAKNSNKDLPVRFWRLKEWETEFKSQTKAVANMLKKYSSTAIISVIQSKKIWSLRPKWVEALIKEEHNKIEAKRQAALAEKQTKPDIKITNNQPNNRERKASKFNKLLDLDG